MSKGLYLHGYSEKEQQRLVKQALFMEELLYSGIDLSPVDNLLEVGAGVGAQTAVLLKRFPGIHITGIDFSTVQLDVAKHYLNNKPEFKDRFILHKMDAESMDFKAEIFDGVFLCWLLEHVQNPMKVVNESYRVLKQDGIFIASEVFNATFYTYPDTPHIRYFWNQYNLFQEKAGGDPNIGAKITNLLTAAGFKNINAEIKFFLADSRNLQTKRNIIDYWTELLLSAAPGLIDSGLITEESTEAVKREFKSIADNPNGVFFCSFVQATAYK